MLKRTTEIEFESIREEDLRNFAKPTIEETDIIYRTISEAIVKLLK
jgi:hypothetical protein